MGRKIGSAASFSNRRGRLCVGTLDGVFRQKQAGVNRFDFYRISARGLFVDARNRLWIASLQGLARIDGERLVRFDHLEGLGNKPLGDITGAPNGDIWVGYRDTQGLARIEFSHSDVSPRVTHFTTSTGLPSDQSYFLGFDSRGWLWNGTDNGVAVYDGKRWRTVDQGDGLIWNDSNQNGFFAEPDGTVWVSTSRGLSRFQPAGAFGSATPDPPVRITGLSFADSPVSVDQPARAPYSHRRFAAQFAVLSFRRPGEFRYRLDGLEDSYNVTRKGEALYPSIPAGSYSLEVSARREDGSWTKPVQYPFSISPPWWQTWWFRALAVAVLVMATLLAWRWRMRALLARQRDLEKAVEERTCEIQRLLQDTRESARLKSHFLATMSHEIRTPLNGIIGMTKLAMESNDPKEQNEYLGLVESSGQTLLGIVNDILDYSRIEAGRMRLESRPFSLRRVVEESVRMAQPKAGQKGLTLSWSISDDVPDRLAGDVHRLGQVLMNLVGNAVKFTAEGGVRVDVDRENTAPSPTVTVCFRVRDTGIGIPAELQERIFEPFRQADESTARQFGGSGLGLSICRELVELMSGRIWLESEPGKGSVFGFTAVFAVAAEPVPDGPGPPAGSERRLRVLIAEDNPISRQLASRLLESRGHTTAMATNGHEALAHFETEPFDLILMDMQMPGMGGIEATTRIRERERTLNRRAAIVAMTAGAHGDDRDWLLAAGVDGYVSKPIDPNELYRLIQSLVVP